MPEYLHPGVYIEEQPAPQTIEGVSTSTAGFVGATEKGPTEGLPQLVTSLPDFLRVFGGYLAELPWADTRYLAYAVEGFFNNGGQRVYIKRVVGAGAVPSTLTLNDGFVTRLLEDTPSQQTARNVVRLASLRGISVNSQLRFSEQIAGTTEAQVRTVTGYNSSRNSVTLNEALTWRYTAAGCQVSLESVADAPLPGSGSPSLRINASSPGLWGDSLQVTVSDADGVVGMTAAASVATTLRALPLAFAAAGPNQGTQANLADVSALQVGDVVEFSTAGATPTRERRTLTSITASTIAWTGALTGNYSGAGSTVQRLTALRSGDNNPTVLINSTAGLQANDLVRLTQGETTQLAQIATIDAGNRQITLNTTNLAIAHTYAAGDAIALATAGRNGSDQLNLSSTNNFYEQAVIEVDDGSRKVYHRVQRIEGRSLILTPALAQAIGSGAVVRVVEFNLLVSDASNSEAFNNLSLSPTAANSVETVVNLRSRLVRVDNLNSTRTPPFNIPRTLTGAAVPLSGGNDGDPPNADDYRGLDNGPGKRTGIKALSDINDISIVAVPGIGDLSVQAELITHCEQLKDRFAVLDPLPGSVIGSNNDSDILIQRGNHDTFYAALYYPWLRIRDPLYPADVNGRIIPPSGHVIGVYARVDVERGVQKAPANEVVRGIIGLEVKLGDREQDVLNPQKVNVIRDFRDSNRGIRVWGSRCLTSDNAWKYVPVRRLFIFLEESLYIGLQWAVFEPNGEDLWARVRRTITGFLRTLWLSGALAGVSEEEAFFVRCDRSTMTEDDIANGRLIVLVGAAPLRPAEFVIVRVSQKTLEATT